MSKKNKVFIATSLDGRIADKDGGLAWLESIPNPDKNDMGYSEFTSQMDAIIMGRNTFETILSFGIDWPYILPVFVMSQSLETIPELLKGKVELMKGSVSETVEHVHKKGYTQLYIDGGQTIQSFLELDLIDEMTIFTFPILLGGGVPLFGKISAERAFDLVDSTVHLNQVVQNRYIRKR